MPVDIVIQSPGESITSGVLSRWLKKSGDSVKKDESVCEVETDKVTIEVVAPEAGVLLHGAKEGDTVKMGAAIGSVDPAGVAAAASSPTAKPAAVGAANGGVAVAAPPSTSRGTPTKEGNGEVRATPLAKKAAAEHGIDLGKLHGTGAGNRIREQDVMDFVQSARPGTPAASGTGPAQALAPQGQRGSTRERMTPLRQRIAARLVQAQHTAAMLTTFNEADMSAVIELRKQYKDDFEKKHGIGLGFMSFFVKAAVGALKAFPLVNASLVDGPAGETFIERHDFFDIAVAVGTPKGLVVPVIRDCDKISFARIEDTIKNLATRAKDGKLTLEEMQGGTFTITNGGIYGSLMSTPILNPPQSAILGMHSIKPRAIEHPAGSGQVAIRPMMYLALSYDHRIIDGAEAVQFLVSIRNAIEDPRRLMLDL